MNITFLKMTISNSFIPNGVPGWSTSQAFDYTEYYNKIKGLRSFQQARNKASCKPDENFKIDYSSKRFYNFTDYETRKNVAVYYRLIHPYCNWIIIILILLLQVTKSTQIQLMNRELRGG